MVVPGDFGDFFGESMGTIIRNDFKSVLLKARKKIKCNHCGFLMQLSKDDKITKNYWAISNASRKFYIKCFSCDKKVLIFSQKILNSKLEILYEEYKRQLGLKISKKQFYQKNSQIFLNLSMVF